MIVAVSAGIGLVLLIIARPLLFASLDPDVASARVFRCGCWLGLHGAPGGDSGRSGAGGWSAISICSPVAAGGHRPEIDHASLCGAWFGGGAGGSLDLVGPDYRVLFRIAQQRLYQFVGFCGYVSVVGSRAIWQRLAEMRYRDNLRSQMADATHEEPK